MKIDTEEMLNRAETDIELATTFDALPNLTLEFLKDAMKIAEGLGKPPPQYKFYPEPSLVDLRQYRFPRSKSKRIRRKWSKRLENWKTVPSDAIYVIAKEACICHPDVIEKILERRK